MFLSGLLGWLDRKGAGSDLAGPAAGVGPVPFDCPPPLEPRPSVTPRTDWPPYRIATAELLWGEGFVLPGGAEEVLRLARPLGLSRDSTLLLLGAGPGGAGQAITDALGCWVAGLESDAGLVALAAARAARMPATAIRRAECGLWDAAAPAFRTGYYHHALALEPLRGAPPEPVLAAITEALKPHGQLVLVELVGEETAGPADHALAAWARAERRPAELPTEAAITRMLGRLGYEVRVTEDQSDRHSRLVLAGWKEMLARLAETEARPTPRQATALVEEAERWLLRLRLMKQRRLRLLRWHAIRRVSAA
ncbi:MAG: hypothetical protein QJR07_19465 [Acetobacteraceae bacterium]|nr:hypothetical protein [Acetobacteraceae bacterium]